MLELLCGAVFLNRESGWGEGGDMHKPFFLKDIFRYFVGKLSNVGRLS